MAYSSEQEVKVVVMGGGGVGKSQIVIRFVTGCYEEGYDPTIEGMHVYIYKDYSSDPDFI